MTSKSYKYRFTLFTATYNRAEMLKSLFNDIKNQDYKGSFEWIIVSDGSTDNTASVVEGFIKSNFLPIKFINKENGGKHTAWRAASPLFEGQYVLTLDDDDPIPSNTLSIFDNHWKILESTPEYDHFWEIRARCIYEDGTLVGKQLPTPYFDSDYNDNFYRMKNPCEMDGCRKREILQTVGAVPEHFIFEEKATNFPEIIRWSRVARIYKTRFIPEITRVYRIGHESLSVTKAGEKRSAKKLYNDYIACLYILNEQRDLLIKYDYFRYIKFILKLAYRRITLNEPVCIYIKHPIDKLLYILFWIPVFILSTIKKQK